MTLHLNLNKEEQKKITTVNELAEYVLAKSVGCEDLSDEEKEKMDAWIMAKLKAGKKLSQKEMEYLRRTNPMMYAQAMRIQKMAEAVEEQLKHARSKEEANRIVSSAISGVSKNDPYKEYIVAAINRVSTEFHKSGAYSKLPNTIEDAKKKGAHTNDVEFSDGEENDKDEFDLMNWSPLTEVYDSMPTFSAGANRLASSAKISMVEVEK